MIKTKHGTYIGPEERLKGQPALLLEYDKTAWKAQFDSTATLELELTHGWTVYPKSFFETDDE